MCATKIEKEKSIFNIQNRKGKRKYIYKYFMTRFDWFSLLVINQYSPSMFALNPIFSIEFNY